MTRMISRRESELNINTKEMTQKGECIYIPVPRCPYKGKKTYQTFLKMQLNCRPDLIELPVDTRGFTEDLSNSFHHSFIGFD